ncbi:MAG: hypothetical protein JSW27_02205 [Phycisphaerales bacterium]|nr:MAG: hypothetical protein JSW27_02205 [Phycisphaerales bacterium]
MKWIGFLLVTVGFVIAALATVVDQGAIQSLDAPTAVDESVDESPIKWLWYVPALAVGVAGVTMIRTTEARQSKTEHHVAANIETVEGSLQRIATNLDQLNAEKDAIDTYDMRHKIDELFMDDLEQFVDARQSIVHRYGLAAYGEIMGSFAAGERYLNRVWSASADGYIDEVNEYLEKAKDQFAESLTIIRRFQATSPLPA